MNKIISSPRSKIEVTGRTVYDFLTQISQRKYKEQEYLPFQSPEVSQSNSHESLEEFFRDVTDRLFPDLKEDEIFPCFNEKKADKEVCNIFKKAKIIKDNRPLYTPFKKSNAVVGELVVSGEGW